MQPLKFKTRQILTNLKIQRYFIRPFTKIRLIPSTRKKKNKFTTDVTLMFSTKCLEALIFLS